jgi:epoxyqueuosine reductase
VEDFCGGCTRCLDQCPTGAFVGPGRLDANKCISYWTIEAKGGVPEGLSDGFGGWIFGCDVCQEVCPWNHKHLRGTADAERIGSDPGYPATGPEWASLLRKGGGFQSRFRKSPLTRAGRRSLLRNLAIASRNLRDTSMIGPLRAALPEEDDPAVRKEIEKALAALGGDAIA